MEPLERHTAHVWSPSDRQGRAHRVKRAQGFCWGPHKQPLGSFSASLYFHECRMTTAACGSAPRRPVDPTADADARLPHAPRCHLAATPTAAVMDPLRRSGQWLESAIGLPHSPRHGSAAAGSAAAAKPTPGTPDWAAPGAHYPGDLAGLGAMLCS